MQQPIEPPVHGRNHGVRPPLSDANEYGRYLCFAADASVGRELAGGGKPVRILRAHRGAQDTSDADLICTGTDDL